MQELGRWPIFSLLDETFLTSLRIACVFGSAGNEAIVITRDDEVYALGSNSSSCLGVGDAQSCLHPRKVEALCKKNIVSLACGSGPHVIAISGSCNWRSLVVFVILYDMIFQEKHAISTWSLFWPGVYRIKSQYLNHHNFFFRVNIDIL